jgi:hypothetical protein
MMSAKRKIEPGEGPTKSGFCMTRNHDTCAKRLAHPVQKPDTCGCPCHEDEA